MSKKLSADELHAKWLKDAKYRKAYADLGKSKPSRMQQALLETTRDFHEGGLASAGALEKVTVRVLGKDRLPTARSLSGDEIRALRERNRVSQGVLAAYLGITVGYLSRLERGEASPSGPVARLLDVIRRKGLEAIQ